VYLCHSNNFYFSNVLLPTWLCILRLATNDVYVFTVESGPANNVGLSFFAKFVEFHAVMFQVGTSLIVYCSLSFVESLNINNILL